MLEQVLTEDPAAGQTAEVGSAFAEATAIHSVGPGAWRGEIDPAWSVWGAPNGGYVSAFLLQAMIRHLDRPERRLRSVTLNFLSPLQPGRVRIETTMERQGRSLSAMTARAVQERGPAVMALAAFGDDRRAPSVSQVHMPHVPPPEDCAPLAFPPEVTPPFSRFLEYRPAGGGMPFAGGERADLLVWLRLSDAERHTAVTATFLVDAVFPALYARLRQPVAVPTIDLTVHHLAEGPADPGAWLLGSFTTRIAADGYAYEDGELWRRDGVLVAQGRQGRRVLVPNARPGA